LKPAQANSSGDLISKKRITKKYVCVCVGVGVTGGMAQGVGLNSNPNRAKTNKQINK
jgi:hypothetical protein